MYAIKNPEVLVRDFDINFKKINPPDYQTQY